MYCFYWEHQQVEGVQSAHGGSLRYEGIGQIKNWYVILKEENVDFHLNINLSAILENFLNYTPVYIHISFFCLYTVWYCFHWEHQQVEGVQSAHGGSLRYEGIGLLQNRYVILKEENLGFHLNIHLSAILENFLNYTQVYINISFFVFTLYCIVSTESTSKLKWVQSAHGGSLRYEGIGQIRNWYVILKEENVDFHLNINMSAIHENFLNYTPVYIHISFLSLHCIVLFPLRAPASWRSAKCTRRLFKIWRNWPNSKLICYSQRGERRLSFEYKFVGHSWKLLKLYPSVH